MSPELHTVGILFRGAGDRRLVREFLEGLGYRVLAPRPDGFDPAGWAEVDLAVAEAAVVRRIEKELLALKARAAAEFSFLPVLVALPPEEEPTSWLSAGFDDVVPLPVAKAVLAARIQVWLRLREETSLRFRPLVEESTIGFYRTTPDGRILYANPALVRMLGFSSFAELSRRNLEEEGFEPAYPRSLFKERIEREGRVVGLESAWVRRDGTTLYVRESARAVRDEEGRVLYYEGTVEDISARKKAEEQLAAIQELGRRLVLTRDLQAIAQAVVEAARDILGLEDCSFYLLPEDQKRLVLLAHTVDPSPGPFEFPLDSPTGIVPAMARSGETLYLPDVTRDPRYVVGTGGNQSELCVPLKVGGRVLGVLNAESPKPDAFSPQDRELLQALAGVAAVALENAHLFAEVDDLREFNEGIVQEMEEGIVIEDAQGILTFVNPAAAHMLSYAPDELVGKPWTVIVDPKSREKVAKERARRPTGSSRYRTDLLTKDGRKVPVLVSARPFFRDGEFAGILAVLTDISESLQAQKALAESEARFRRLAENAPDIIYRYRLLPEPGFEYVNPAATTITGYTPEEHYADPDLGLKIVHPEDRPLLQALREGRDFFQRPIQLRWRRKDGQVIWTEQINIPIYDENGNLVAIEGIARDITERKLTEERGRESLARLERLLNQAVDLLSSATELRDPYTAGHQRRVADLACAIAQELGFPEDRVQGLRVAALLHDFGKSLAVPGEILSKPGRLTKEEMNLIRAHPEVGYEILRKIEFPWPVAETVRQHHERLDGSGYPQSLRGEEILVEARILAVADVVEAMTSHRPYRPALGIEQALAEIEAGKGRLYDPQVVEACLAVFERGFSFSPS